MLWTKADIAKYMEKIWTQYVKCTTVGPTVVNDDAVLWRDPCDFLVHTYT